MSSKGSRSHQIASGSVDLDLKRTSTGVHTVEGNVAGARAARLTQKREAEALEYEARKKKIQDDARLSRNIDDRFNTSQLQFKSVTEGLTTKEEFSRAQEESLRAVAEESGEQGPSAAAQAAARKKQKKEKKAKKRALAALSFGADSQDEGGQPPAGPASDAATVSSSGAGATSPSAAAEEDTAFVPKKRLKNPSVKTDFLPDRQREEAEQQLREELKQQWLEQQTQMKAEKLQVTYSYWDGSGHRRTITVAKGVTVGKFLEAVRQDIAADFHELRTASSDSLLYIKEDLIIPHHYTFYDLIATKARGKSGPLFHFDVHDDVRMVNDSRVEKDESHPGKIVERHWYERNKHIFPASRWEVYDPTVQRGSYSIHGGEVN